MQKNIIITLLVFMFNLPLYAELSNACNDSLVEFSKVEKLKDDIQTIQASKKTVGICISTLPKDVTNEDVGIINFVMQLGKKAENRYLNKGN